jgi:hypothetical protein
VRQSESRELTHRQQRFHAVSVASRKLAATRS